MTVLNYFFIGFVFTFLIDILMSLKHIKNHPKMENHIWEMKERIMCIFIWPIAFIVFFIAFLKAYFK